MITVTARVLITDAFKLANVLASGETPNANDAMDALRRLNALIDGWGIERLTRLTLNAHRCALVAGTQTYTIGETGAEDFTFQRPVYLDQCKLVVPGTDPELEIGVGLLTDEAYQDLVVKTLESTYVTQLYYNPTEPLGTLWFWPNPTQNQDVVLYYPDQTVAQFANLATSVTLAPGYERALRYNLAVEICTEWGRAVPPMLAQTAVETLQSVKRANLPMIDLDCDPALLPEKRPYNIYTGP